MTRLLRVISALLLAAGLEAGLAEAADKLRVVTTTADLKALTEAVDYVKTELMPNFDFDAFNHDEVVSENGEVESAENAEVTSVAVETPKPVAPAEVVSSPAAVDNTNNDNHEEVDKW